MNKGQDMHARSKEIEPLRRKAFLFWYRNKTTRATTLFHYLECEVPRTTICYWVDRWKQYYEAGNYGEFQYLVDRGIPSRNINVSDFGARPTRREIAEARLAKPKTAEESRLVRVPLPTPTIPTLDEAITQWTQILDRASRATVLEGVVAELSGVVAELKQQVGILKQELDAVERGEQKRREQEQAYKVARQQGDIKVPDLE